MQGTDISFSKIIRIGERLREFNFRKLPGTESFGINVTDDKGKRILFNLHKNPDGSWTIQGQDLPQWLQFAESHLGGAIEKELKP
jgi:hypothetical protein